MQLLTPILSELALKHGTLPDAKSTFEELGFAVFSLERPNYQLARHLIDQAKASGLGIQLPMVFYGLKTVKDDNFADSRGLKFDFAEDTVGYHVSVLSKLTGKFKSTDPSLVQNGFPSDLGEGDRTLYTAKDGLGRVYRNRILNLYASFDDLPGWGEAGRVSFVKGEAPQNLEAALKAIEAEKRRQEETVAQRFEQAMKLMKG